VLLPRPVQERLLGSIEAHNLVLLCGAGLSIPDPSNLMSAVAVARKVYRHFVSVGFVDGTGSRFVVTRYRDKPDAEGLVDVLCRMHDERVAAGDPVSGSALMKTTLIRDEFISASSLDLPGQQRFNTVRAAIGAIIGPDHSKRTGKILAEAKDVLSNEQGRLNMQQAELGRLLAQLTEARTEAAQSSDISEALKLVAEAVPNHEVRASAEEVRRMIADRRAALANFNRARARSDEMSEQRTRVRSDAFKREMSTVEEELQQANLTLAANQHNADLARRLVGTEEQSDLQGSHFAALLEHGSVLGLQEGHCPLCEAVRTDRSEPSFIVKGRLGYDHLLLAGRGVGQGQEVDRCRDRTGIADIVEKDS
jgi:chromosome segregation protein